MPQTPLTVSIVIPTYRGCAFLRSALESVFAQSEPADEVVVVDDGCPDETWRIAASFNPQVRVIHQPNRGMAAARNAGALATRSQWIALLDQDDRHAPEWLATVRQQARAHPSARWIYSGWFSEQARSGEREPVNSVRVAEFAQQIRFRNRLLPSFSAIQRDAYFAAGGFPESRDLLGVDDHAFLLRFWGLHGIQSFVQVPGTMGIYLVHASNVSRLARLHLKGRKALLPYQLEGLTGIEKFYWRQLLQARIYRDVALLLREAGEPDYLAPMLNSLLQWPLPSHAIPGDRARLTAYMLLSRVGLASRKNS